MKKRTTRRALWLFAVLPEVTLFDRVFWDYKMALSCSRESPWADVNSSPLREAISHSSLPTSLQERKRTRCAEDRPRRNGINPGSICALRHLERWQLRSFDSNLAMSDQRAMGRLWNPAVLLNFSRSYIRPTPAEDRRDVRRQGPCPCHDPCRPFRRPSVGTSPVVPELARPTPLLRLSHC